MRCFDGERLVLECSIHGPKTGHQFTRIELMGRDFADLLDLSPEYLREWMAKWSLGFPPRALW